MTNQNPNNQQVLSDSYVDVVFQSLRDADFLEGEFRVYDRFEALQAVRGEHFFRTGTFGAFSELVIGDYPEDLAAPFLGRQLREAVIRRGPFVQHFIFDIANDQNLLVKNELRENKNERVVYDAQTPAHFTQEHEDDLSVFTRRSGVKYNQWLGNRIMAIELLSDEKVVDTFLDATKPFVDECIVRSNPEVSSALFK
ncbi:MAG: hypothetical protein ABIR37_02950 [Candidatus Saccharimonadales bacterium]